MDWQKNDDDRVEGSARQGVELGVEETETGRNVVEGEGERERERELHTWMLGQQRLGSSVLGLSYANSSALRSSCLATGFITS